MTAMISSLGSNSLLLFATAALIVIGGVLILRAREDMMTADKDDAGAETTAAYRQAYEKGQMSFEEYQRILDRLANRRTESRDDAREALRPGRDEQPPEAPVSATELPGDQERMRPDRL